MRNSDSFWPVDRLLNLALRLYPRAWLDRYEAELRALIEDSRRNDFAMLVDILQGGISMRLSDFLTKPVLITAAFFMGIFVMMAAVLPNAVGGQ